MIELLKLCGFKEKDIKSELSRVEKAFHRLGITAEDIERGKQRLAMYYDTGLEGVRKVLRLIVLELVDSILARDEGKTKVIYGFMSPGICEIGAVAMNKSEEVYAVHHSWAFQFVVGCIFDKIIPILEAAERKWLKAGVVAHCSNVKSFLGLIALDLVPRPDLVTTSGSLCEIAPKTLDLLHELYDMPVCCFATCQDRELRDYPEATRRTVSFGAKSLRTFAERVQEIAGFEITDDMLWEVINARNQLDNALRKLRELVASSDPLPLSATHQNLWYCLTQLTLSREYLPDAIDAINTVYEEVNERVERGQGIVEKGAPRVLSILPLRHTDPRLEHLVGELGIAMVAFDGIFGLPPEGSSEDPYWTLLMRLQQAATPSIPARRIPFILELCKRFHVDGVLAKFHIGCRTVAGDAIIIRDAVEKELGIPAFLLEWENFDPRGYDHGELKRQLDVFKTMMLTRRSD